MDKSQTEPAKQTGAQGALIGVIVAGAAVAAAFGLDLTKEQLGGIVVFVGACFALAPYLTALKIRGKVFSPASTQKLINRAHAAGEAGQAPPVVVT